MSTVYSSAAGRLVATEMKAHEGCENLPSAAEGEHARHLSTKGNDKNMWMLDTPLPNSV